MSSPPTPTESPAAVGRSLLAAPTLRADAIGGSRMAAAISGFDWAATPLGPTEQWPQSLKSAVRLLLGSRYPMFVWWGPELIALYNDAYIDVLGPRHPWALGRSARETWSELWGVVGPQTDAVLAQGLATWNDRVLLVMERKGFTEETYFTFSYSPCFNDDGEVGGVFCACKDETHRVLGERRLQSLSALSASVLEARSAAVACERAAAALAGNRHDLPFVLVYLQERPGVARLAARGGLPEASPLAPPETALDDGAAGPWVAAARAAAPQTVDDLPRIDAVPAGPWPEPVQQALVLPLALHGEAQGGFVVLGLNPRRPLDADYRDWLALLAQQLSGAIARARGVEEEQQRLQALAELDRAKTTFFSNVSHELRTPLSLMLGPVGDLLGQPGLAEPQRDSLQLVLRNGRRLQRLVNALLDFSRIEAGRLQARFGPLDLGASTTELASFFHSAAAKAGLALAIECERCPPVYVDRLLWEKVVFNLVSNAIKYTLAGSVTVRVRADGDGARLDVADTGIGIPPQALGRVFERFYRVEGAAGRSIEGSGIGLALVAELVRMHGGTVSAASEPGRGSTFSVRLPFGKAHLPAAQVDEAGEESASPARLDGWLDEIDAWLGEEPLPEAAPPAAAGSAPAAPVSAPRGRILLVDDNADMRAYLAGLLGRDHEVRTAADGLQALARVAQQVPDLVLTDVMMPRMDGFALLRHLRSAPATAALPVVMLSAHAGDEARLQALEAGADDFMVKPFHARELLARVSGALKLSRLRRDAMSREQALRAEVENVLESITEGFVALDAEWRFSYVNAAAEKLYGQSREQLLGRDYWEVFPQVAGSVFEAPYRRAMAERRPVTVDGPYEPLAGWFEVNVYPVATGGLAFYFRDVLQHRVLQQSLRESEQRFREMAEAMPQIVFVCDALQRIEYLNHQWRDYTGRAGAQHEDLLVAVHPSDVQGYLERWAEAADRRTPVSAEIRLRRAADGSYRWFLTRAVPVFDGEGRVLRWYGTATDIDRPRRNAEALAQAHGALQQAERRKDQFIATLAHELRNPLAPLRNGVQLLAGPDGRHDAARLVGMMRRQVDQLTRLVDDLLEVSRITSGKVTLQRSTQVLGDILASAVETSRPLIEAGRHTLETDVAAAGSMLVDGDAVRLGQVFANLLNNSAKYTEPGGRIVLRAARQGQQAVVTVQDNGMGMDAAVLQDVFEAFVQVDRSRARAQGGLGIGLSIVRSLVELHGGTVSAASDGPGRGSLFTVRLPLCAAAAVPAHREVAAPAPVACAGGPLSVLVVDDNRDAADSLAAMLELMGASVRVAYGGAAAISAAEAETPALVLLDLGMPGMDGYEVARRLGALGRRPDMQLVALTGWGQSDDRLRTREAGFDDHLVKPADIESLQRLLASAATARTLPAAAFAGAARP